MSLLICELESGTAFAWFWVNFWVSVRRGSFEVRFSKDTKKTIWSTQMILNVREKIRTPDLLIRSQTLYPAELIAHFVVCSVVSLTTKKII